MEITIQYFFKIAKGTASAEVQDIEIIVDWYSLEYFNYSEVNVWMVVPLLYKRIIWSLETIKEIFAAQVY